MYNICVKDNIKLLP